MEQKNLDIYGHAPIPWSRLRFIRLHTPADAAQPDVKRLVKRAFALVRG